ncbi:hypothetical protein ACFYOK_35580 [Microbispora bryophytorum]|uniref:hypothetical protein n=1 Tax=Microbispora bryophytorum TaxID=1460882 RepID=UPI0033E62EEE
MNVAPLTAAQELTWLGLNADNWIAVAAGGIGLAGVVIAWRALVHARRSAESADESAKAAQRSAEEAATISRIERDRRHDDLAPPHPGEIQAEEESDTRLGAGHYNVFGSITVPRDYRVRAQAWNGTSLTPIALPLLLRANQPYRFHLDRLREGVTSGNPTEIRFRFWPPVPDLDDTDAWTCPCSRPAGTDVDARGHWELRVPIAYLPEIEVY